MSHTGDARFPSQHSKGTQFPGRKVRVLGFDAAKVHEFLFHVALAEVQWQDLGADGARQTSLVLQKQRATSIANHLYDGFLRACTKGPRSATSFLARQHELQKMYLYKTRALLAVAQRRIVGDQVLLSEVSFGAQTVKSVAIASVAIMSLFLVGSAAVVGAGVVLGLDVSVELINKLGSYNDPKADAVVVGFKQTVVNDIVGVAGSTEEVTFANRGRLLEKTLSYPLRSSTYRSLVETQAHLDVLMKALGWITAGITLYSEFNTTKASYEQMREAQTSYSQLGEP